METTEVLAKPETEIQFPILREANPQDVDQLARVQWFARKKAVQEGYLPPVVLPDQYEKLSHTEGIEEIKKELTRYYYGNLRSKDSSGNEKGTFRVCAEQDDSIIGTIAVDYDTKTKVVTLSDLDVLPEHQGKRVATMLRHQALVRATQRYPSFQLVEVNKFSESLDHINQKLSASSSKVHYDKAERQGHTYRGYSYTALQLPFTEYYTSIEKSLPDGYLP